jgi:uncharacterized membrane protein YuzA (DUF378 family)
MEVEIIQLHKMVLVVVLAVVVLMLLLELELVVLVHQDRETLAARVAVALIGLVAVVVALLRLVQITQPYKQAVRGALVQPHQLAAHQ